jgi:hypothetical protein
MSVIAAVADGASVTMMADSGLTDESRAYVTDTPKMARCGELLIGWAGSPRYGQVVTYCWEPPPRNGVKDDMEYLVRSVIPSLWRVLTNAFVTSRVEGSAARVEGSQTIIGYRGAVYTMDEYFALSAAVEGYDAIGSGQGYALGALYATEGEPVATRLTAAMAAAVRFDQYTRAPFISATTVSIGAAPLLTP